MKILLLSAYDAVSHRRWREGLVRHLDDFHWTVLTLPPRNFAWRSRGNALTWAHGEREKLNRDFDLVLATSMTDLASLRGMVRSLAAVPAVAYFHENQFAYPERVERKESLNFKLTNLYTALAAEFVLFNSIFNRDSFLEGIREMLAFLPDCVPPGVTDLIGARSAVLPVPLEEDCFPSTGRAPVSGPLTLVWNHRWEHDKAPERFFAAVKKLMVWDVPFKIHILGQRFREVPDVFATSRNLLKHRVGQYGFVEDRQRYRRLLSESDVVVSTALHDFQGMSVLDATAAGCLPLVPDRMAYREFFPDTCRYRSLPEDPDTEVEVLAHRLMSLCSNPDRARNIPVPDVKRFSWENLGPRYRKKIIEAVQSSGTRVLKP